MLQTKLLSESIGKIDDKCSNFFLNSQQLRNTISAITCLLYIDQSCLQILEISVRSLLMNIFQLKRKQIHGRNIMSKFIQTQKFIDLYQCIVSLTFCVLTQAYVQKITLYRTLWKLILPLNLAQPFCFCFSTAVLLQHQQNFWCIRWFLVIWFELFC